MAAESAQVTFYRLAGDPERTQHSYRHLGSSAHIHDGKVRHEHESGEQFHHHYPGVPPGYEPAFLEG